MNEIGPQLSLKFQWLQIRLKGLLLLLLTPTLEQWFSMEVVRGLCLHPVEGNPAISGKSLWLSWVGYDFSSLGYLTSILVASR